MAKKKFALHFHGSEEEFNKARDEFIKYMEELEIRISKLEKHRHHTKSRKTNNVTNLNPYSKINSLDRTSTPIFEEKD